ncbi:tetratricopeptide repeat-containing protein [Caulobacter sp.]|uniref:tetratricopeptide repeat-containing protein n=1 Tax=Caulobacter sp. TaxID=78 RepID=UPI002B4893A4|nr:tetratricopeptide repeat-containing protein [Caulobacter sp.]HJV42576.1 tetratricopeptide repeat-containing protein [Caulobacter sp.]
MSQSSPLVDIMALARTGAVEEAWRLFGESGLAAAQDPAALTLKGRLLKDRARTARGQARRDLFVEAAAAYRQAAQRGQGAYALINAATLSLLAGEIEAARANALAALDAPDNDTPYYQGATRAEALLVLGRTDEAKAALTEAVSRAPRAWEDHAVTLRQFRLILTEQGQGDDWLSVLTPPRALHFTGHMALSADEGLAGRIADVLGQEKVAFGYGAIAAGADILIAEALVEAGAALHVVLPTNAEVFRERSVRPWGEAWVARYDRLLVLADSVQATTPDLARVSRDAIALADETAMGMTVLKAASLAGEALQLAMLDPERPDASGSAAARWRGAGRRQQLIEVRRLPPAQGADEPTPPERAPTALLGCALDLPLDADPTEALATLSRVLAAAPAGVAAPAWTGRQLLLAYATPGQAAQAAAALRAALGPRARLAGAHGLARLAASPVGHGTIAIGRGAEIVTAYLAVTPPGAVYLDLPFAAALCVDAPPDLVGKIMNLTGDALGPYALRP